MSYQNAAELFKELSKVLATQEQPKASLMQVRVRDGSLRWITSIGTDVQGQLIFDLSSDRNDVDIGVPEILSYIAKHLKASIRAGGDHPSDAMFHMPVWYRNDTYGWTLRDLTLDGSIVILES